MVGEYEDLISLVNNIENIELNINLKVKHYLKESASLLEKFYLNKDIINKKISELSNTEYKIISLIKTIELNPEFIILKNFEIGINEKYLNNIIRFLKILIQKEILK